MISGDIIERELKEILKAQTIDESMIEGISVSDENGIIFYTNPAEDRKFGRSRDELIRRQLISQNTRSSEESVRISKGISQRLQITGCWEGEFINQKYDGVLLAKLARIISLEYEGRKYWVRIQEDITERKQAEVAQAYLAAIVESSDDAIIGKTLRGIITSWNKGAENIFGYTASEIIGQPINTLIPPDRQEEEVEILERLGRGERVDYFETVRLRKDGRLVDVSITISPIKDSRGRIVGASKVARDISERKQAELAQAYLAAIVESADDAIIGKTLQGIILSWNKGAENIFGYTASEIIGQPINILLPSDRQEEEVEILERLGRGERIDHFETVRVRKDGRLVDVSITISPIMDSSGRIVGASKVARDISERKRLEEALYISEAKCRGLLDRLPAGAYTCDAEGLITYYNERAVEIWGRAPKLNDPEDRFCGSFKIYESGGALLRHDRCWMAMALEEDTEYNGHEIMIERPDGSRLPVLAHANPIHDEFGKLISAVNVLVDISDRKRAEVEREELLMKEKEARAEAQAANRSKDEFISLISHELRSPLNSILGYNRKLRSNPNDATQISQTCDIIERNARTQLRLIEDLLDTARIVSGKLRLDLRPTDIVPVVASALDVVRPVAEAKGIKLRAHYNPKPEMVNGDSVRLQQVIGNLLSNAIKFTPDGGRVELWLKRSDEDICIVVNDTGKGIEPEFLPHVFDRFRQADSSSSRRHGGLGLGLALVKHLVELHGGTVEAASEGIGFGATFTVTLPLAAQTGSFEVEPPVLQTEGAIELPDTAMIEGVSVLAVDDQQEAREVLADFLSKRGAIVTAVSSGSEALEVLTDPPCGELPDVLICDIAMPDEDGYAVLKRVRALEAERGVKMSQRVPAIALTAMGKEDWAQALSAGFNRHVAKPADPAELAAIIASVVRERQLHLR